MKLRIGILGTRGIPNNYGGFEYFAEHLSQGLANKGYEVYVYCSHNHPNRLREWNGVQIVHCYDPEYLLGTAGQFIYDLNCINDARKRDFDILLFLGYTSSSVWGFLTPPAATVIYNMDGLEWQRSKYSKPVQKFLQYAEKLAIRNSDFFVADSTYIQRYLEDKYKVRPEYIAYGANTFRQPDKNVLQQYGLEPHGYNMLMARMEPENNIEMILDGYHQASSPFPFIVVGNTGNKFGRYLVNKFAGDARICFAGAIFNQVQVSNLIYFSNLYFHGHSVGGTNPSLLEAMGCQGFIVAQDNVFNKAVLESNGYYFNTAADVQQYADMLVKNEGCAGILAANTRKIETLYNWSGIIDSYESFFLRCLQEKKSVARSLPTLLQPTRQAG
jgi:glycosyltransferase involved in cell wall biosynthesis